MTNPVPRWDLSGSGELKFTIAPDMEKLRSMRMKDGHLLLEKWGTLVHEETDGRITWSGVVRDAGFEDQEWTVTCKGVSTYAYGMPYTGDYSKEQIDPADIVRHLWAHMQGFPDGDLGVAVTGSTKVRVGTKKKEVSFKTGAGTSVDFDAGPYELHWWDARDIGREIDSLAQDTPFDWVEHHRWNADKTDVIHEIQIGYPRIGRHRTDLLFELGANVIDFAAPEVDGSEYANSVFGIGAGEGKKSVRRSTAKRDGRLRRVAVETDKSATSNARLDAKIRNRLNASLDVLRISEITVKQHPNARIGSWSVGDDITFRAKLPWLGEISPKLRVVNWSLVDQFTAKLALERSDSFIYGG
ncbi:hypothetical protein ACSAGD_10750 [Paramicrobacterium sp. CJ85]|uniref:hypothetical protein n=1 Tax=Paramicrobacterium sp. CJ85 TaxID=3445355 RepID=UPI003F630795